ncbi:Yip1 family protein [Glaciecola sp. MF2-115]|uniref:Yip1 family protein n=1 Tax=Glaciecola sp. MF2-115 TaxID=3384827 RepID=UPI0039A0DFA3
MSENQHEVTNPLQACNDVFIRPSEVFKALSLKDNWSWIPFILVVVVSSLPAYLYFGVVDFEWYINSQLSLSMPDASPAELENMRAMSGSAETAKLSALIGSPIFLAVIAAVMGLYYTVITRNDEKSIHSFFDWYGAQWWFMMPTLIASVISMGLILMVEPGAQVGQSILSPTSLAYIFSVDPSSKWTGLLSGLRLETIWTIYLGAVCLQQWTNFSTKKSYIVAASPTVVILAIVFLWALF